MMFHATFFTVQVYPIRVHSCKQLACGLTLDSRAWNNLHVGLWRWFHALVTSSLVWVPLFLYLPFFVASFGFGLPALGLFDFSRRSFGVDFSGLPPMSLTSF